MSTSRRVAQTNSTKQYIVIHSLQHVLNNDVVEVVSTKQAGRGEVSGVDKCERRVTVPRDCFHDDGSGEIARIPSAVFFWSEQGQETVLGENVDAFAGENVLLVNLQRQFKK